jgi:hypothetical protein
MLLIANHPDLSRAYNKAIEMGYSSKARALESFLISEDKFNGQYKPITKRHRRHINRKRVVRTIGDKKKRIGRPTVPA